MRDLVGNSPRFFAVALLAGLSLRLGFFFAYPRVSDDSRIYADIARNWLHHGIYGLSASGSILPTYIRLPGYPAFLAAVFALFGDNNFRAVFLLQIAFDLGTCWLIADIAWRLAGSRAAQAAFVFAALCPFLADYAAAALTETVEILFTALALDLGVVALQTLSERRFHPWIGCGLAIAGAIYMRPDGGLLLVAIGLYLCRLLLHHRDYSDRGLHSKLRNRWPAVWAGILLLVFSLLPLGPWAGRNVRTMHSFQLLAPRYANEPGEFVPSGFNRWVKTWMADYVSVEEIYWQEPGTKIDIHRLPSRAFDSTEQRLRTQEILDEYNESTDIDPDLDREFRFLAEQRIRGHRLRYYVWLPALRIADMWLRPRTELLPADPRWWEFNDDLKWIVVSVSFAVINLLYLGLAAVAILRVRPIPYLGMFLLFLIARSLFLGALENPEPRYTLECYPAIMVLASTYFARVKQPSSTKI